MSQTAIFFFFAHGILFDSLNIHFLPINKVEKNN